MTVQEALVVLNAVPGLGAGRIREALSFFSTPNAVLEATEEAWYQAGLSQETWLNMRHVVHGSFLSEEVKRVTDKGVTILTCMDSSFPQAFKEIPEAPVVIYVKGDVACLNRRYVAMVGSRGAFQYGRRVAREFAGVFAQAKLGVVSGLARGIDTASHEGCLEQQGVSIGVIGCGLEVVYPPENRKLYEQLQSQGAVISEYPMTTPPIAFNFPWRNRLISALGDVVVVIEAREKSGALITADYAGLQGKDVFVVPANIDNPQAKGSNKLIRDGALVALEPADVLHYLGVRALKIKQPLTTPQKAVNLSPECLRALSMMETAQACHLDTLTTNTVLTVPQWQQALLELELAGLIEQWPGQYYVKVA